MNSNVESGGGEDDAEDSIVAAYSKSVFVGLAGVHTNAVQAAMIVLRQRLIGVRFICEL
jgi:hypothetical protein